MAKNTKKDALKGMLAASGKGGPGMQSMPAPAPQTSFRNPLMPATAAPAPAGNTVPALNQRTSPALAGTPTGPGSFSTTGSTPAPTPPAPSSLAGSPNASALSGGNISLPGGPGTPAPTQPLQKKNVIKSLMKVQSPQDRYKGLTSPDAKSAGPSPKPAQLYPGTQAPSEQQLKDFQGGRPMQF